MATAPPLSAASSGRVRLPPSIIPPTPPSGGPGSGPDDDPTFDLNPPPTEYSQNADNGESRFTIYTRPINVEVGSGHVIFRPGRGPDAAGLDGILPVYRQTNDRHPIVAVDYVVPQNVPSKLEVTLKLDRHTNEDPVYFSLSGAKPGQVVRLSVQADDVGELPTGHYSFQIEVKDHHRRWRLL